MAEVDITKYVRLCWKWLWLVLLCAAVSGAVTYYATKAMPRVYRTSTSLLVGANAVDPGITADDLQVTQRATAGYVAIVRRQPILDGTIKALGLPTTWPELANRVVASSSANG